MAQACDLQQTRPYSDTSQKDIMKKKKEEKIKYHTEQEFLQHLIFFFLILSPSPPSTLFNPSGI